MSSHKHSGHQKTLKVNILKLNNLSLVLKAFSRIKSCHGKVFSSAATAHEHNAVTDTMIF